MYQLRVLDGTDAYADISVIRERDFFLYWKE